MSAMSLLQFIERLTKASLEMELCNHHALNKAGKMIADEAKAIVGHYQPQTGPYAAWKPLADSTLAEKQKRGQAPPDNPLIATGHLRDSIHHSSDFKQASIGSADEDAIYHEMGTRHEPPRPFLGPAAIHVGPHLPHVFGASLVMHIAGKKLP